MPMRTVCSGATFGEKPPIRDSSAGSGPSSAASGMPCTLPLAEVRRRVHVAVRVDPDQAERLAARAGRNRRSPRPNRRPGSGRRRARAGCRRFSSTRERRLVEPLADARDLADVFLGRVAERLDLRDRRDQIALVDDREAERGEPFAEPGNAERRGPHVDAAAVAAEVERDADDVSGSHEPSARRDDRSAGTVLHAARLTTTVNVGYSDSCGGDRRGGRCCRSRSRVMKRFEVGARVVEPTYGLGIRGCGRRRVHARAVRRARRQEIPDQHVAARTEQRAGAGRPAQRQAAQEARSPRRPPRPPPPRPKPTSSRRPPHRFSDTDIPSPDGATIVVQSDGFFWIASRKSPISLRLLTTLWARNRPPLSSRGRQVEEPLVVVLPRVEEDEVERPGELRDLLERVAGDDLHDVASARPA